WAAFSYFSALHHKHWRENGKSLLERCDCFDGRWLDWLAEKFIGRCGGRCPRHNRTTSSTGTIAKNQKRAATRSHIFAKRVSLGFKLPLFYGARAISEQDNFGVNGFWACDSTRSARAYFANAGTRRYFQRWH